MMTHSTTKPGILERSSLGTPGSDLVKSVHEQRSEILTKEDLPSATIKEKRRKK
ncbi:hypothetical protein HY641_03620 [Candidatus Woesearchaeota archaeon]|nr:hypothetical protein [Candidatus Woesearchaeota archaeon]